MSEQVLDIPLGKGLAEGFDEKVLPFGNAARLDNLEVDLAGGVTKRQGWAKALNAATLSGATPGATVRLDGDGDTLRLVAVGGDGLPAIYTQVTERNAWAEGDNAGLGTLRRTPLARSSVATLAVAGAPLGDAYELVVFVTFDSAGVVADGVFVQVLDRRGVVVLGPAQIGTAGLTSLEIAAVPVGNDAWIFWSDGELYGRRYDGTTLAATTITVDSDSAVYQLDAAVVSSTTVALAYRKNSAVDTISLRTITSATATVAASLDYTDTASVERPRLAANATAIRCAYWREASGPTYDLLVLHTPASLASSAGPYLVETRAAQHGHHGIEIDASGDSYVLAETSNGPRDGRLRWGKVTSAGAITTLADTVWRARLASAPRLINGRVLVLLTTSQAGGLGCDAASLNLSDFSGSFVRASLTLPGPVAGASGSAPQVFDAGLYAVDDPTDRYVLLGKAVTLAGLGGSLPVCSKLWARGNVWSAWGSVVESRSLQGIDRIDLDVSVRQRGASQPVYPRPLLAHSGALPLTYDGAAAVELSFFQAPGWETPEGRSVGSLGTLAATPAPGSLYLYRARYEWVDARGTFHASPWSPDFAVTLESSPASTMAVALRITTTQVSRRTRPSVGASRAPRVAVYRSTAGGAGPSGDVVYYRLRPYHQCPPVTSAQTVEFLDDDGDAGLLLQGLGQVVSPGDLLAPFSPPAAEHLCMHLGRLWLASAETGRDLWASRLLIRDEPPVFAPELRVTLADAPDPITALASLDDKLAIFTRTRIYYLTGEGPADNGTGNAFAQPWPIVTQHGCLDARSVVTTPQGVFFQTAAGIALLDRSLNAQLLGESVRATVEAFPTCLASVHDAPRSRALWLLAGASGAVVAIWDYLHQVWSTASTDAFATLDGLALWGEALVVASGSTYRAEREPSTSSRKGLDTDAPNAGVWVEGVYETPWICPGGPNAYQRMRRLILLGQRLAGCSVRVQVYLNFDATTAAATHTVDLDAGSTVAGLPLLRYELPLSVQASQAIKIRLTDLAPPTAEPPVTGLRAGMAWQRLALEYLPERGTPRLPATNRGGTG